MLITTISSFSHNTFCPIKDKDLNHQIKNMKFGSLQVLSIWSQPEFYHTVES